MSDPVGERALRRRGPGAPADGDDLQIRSPRRAPGPPSDTGAGRAAARRAGAGGAEAAGSEGRPPLRGGSRTPRRSAGRADEPAGIDRTSGASAERAPAPRSATSARRARGAPDDPDATDRDTAAARRRRKAAGQESTAPAAGGGSEGGEEKDRGTATPGRTGRPPRGTVTPPAGPDSSRTAVEPPVRGPGGRWPMAERSVLATVLGVPPVAAVGLAAALTAVGVLVDLTRIGGLGAVFTICHISGCVLAVAWVRRTGLFGPMVQPPLLVAVSVPVVVLLSGPPRPGQGVAEQLLVIGAPLVNAFPVMAWTTGTVLVFGLLRLLLQRPVEASALSGRSGRGAARGAGRTSASPRRS